MSGRRIFLGVMALALVAGCAAPVEGQRTPYGVEEYNAYVDTTQAKDPAARLQAIEAFLKQYPQSVLRAFVYPNQAQTAFSLQRYPKTIEAVEGFLALDRAQVAAFYKQSNPNIDDLAIDKIYYQVYLLYIYSFLQSFRDGTPQADAAAAQAVERAQQGLELHERLYSQVQPPAEEAQRKQFEETKQQQGASFHNVLAFTSYRKKDYATAAREYAVLVNFTPHEATLNYRLGLSSLQKEPREWETGFWHVARAVALNIAKSDDVREYLLKNVAAYQGVLPACSTRQVDMLIARAQEGPRPPADWRLVRPERVSALRQDLSVKRIFDDLKAGGEPGQAIWLASCGMEFPELDGEVIEVSQSADNLVTLRVAVTEEAAEAKIPNLEVKVVAPPEAKNLKAGDPVRFSGILSDYASEPRFLVKLTEGRVNAESIPKPTPAPRRRGGGGAR